MTLNDFIARAVSFFDRAESIEAKEREKLALEISALQTSLATSQAAAKAADEKIKALEAQLGPQTLRLAQLESELASEKAKVTETLAGMGVKPETIPADAATTVGKPSILSKFEEISDPRERAEFWTKNKAAILAAIK